MNKPIITGFGYVQYTSNIDIYHMIMDEPKCWDPKEYTYLITGRQGPTGKSWLAKHLNDAGLKAIDISERLGPIVEMINMAGNYLTIDHANKVVYILLNDINDVYISRMKER